MLKKIKIAFIGDIDLASAIVSSHALMSQYDIINIGCLEDDQNVLKDLIDFRADINIILVCSEGTSSVLPLLLGVKIYWSNMALPILQNGKVTYSRDTVDNLRLFRNICLSGFDYVFHMNANVKSFLELQGIFLSDYIPIPVCTSKFIANEQTVKQWDFIFHGEDSNKREKCFGALKHDFQFLHISSGINGVDLIPYLNASKLFINLSKDDVLASSEVLLMAFACEILVLSEPLHAFQNLLPNIHYLPVNDSDNFYRVAVSYLSNYDKLKRVSQNARFYVESNFSADKVFPEIVNKIIEKKYSGVMSGNPRLEIAKIDICC